MKYCVNLLLLLAITMALSAIAVSATSITAHDDEFMDLIIDDEDSNNETQAAVGGSGRRAGRFLADHARNRRMTCNKNPRICWRRGSPGPSCCKKRCVNVFEDRSNCGRCGKKCRHWEVCCGGRCVNPWSNHQHCGACNNACNTRSSCVYGLCSYA